MKEVNTSVRRWQLQQEVSDMTTESETPAVLTHDESKDAGRDPQSFSLTSQVPVKRTDWHVSPLKIGENWSVMWGNVQVALVGYRDYAVLICNAMNSHDRLLGAVNSYFDREYDGDPMASWESELWYAAEKAKGEWSPW